MLKKKNIALLMVGVLAIGFVGCTNKNGGNTQSTQASGKVDEIKKEEAKPYEIPNASIATEEDKIDGQLPPFVIKGQDGKEVHLKFDSPEVKEVNNVLEQYEQAYYNRNYQNIKGDEQYSFYSKNFVEKLKSKNDVADTVKFFKDNKLDIEYTGFTGAEPLTFNESMTKAAGTYEKIIFFRELSDEYAKANKFNKTSNFSITVEFKLVKEDGQWKIDDYKDSIKIVEEKPDAE